MAPTNEAKILDGAMDIAAILKEPDSMHASHNNSVGGPSSQNNPAIAALKKILESNQTQKELERLLVEWYLQYGQGLATDGELNTFIQRDDNLRALIATAQMKARSIYEARPTAQPHSGSSPSNEHGKPGYVSPISAFNDAAHNMSTTSQDGISSLLSLATGAVGAAVGAASGATRAIFNEGGKLLKRQREKQFAQNQCAERVAFAKCFDLLDDVTARGQSLTTQLQQHNVDVASFSSDCLAATASLNDIQFEQLMQHYCDYSASVANLQTALKESNDIVERVSANVGEKSQLDLLQRTIQLSDSLTESIESIGELPVNDDLVELLATEPYLNRGGGAGRLRGLLADHALSDHGSVEKIKQSKSTTNSKLSEFSEVLKNLVASLKSLFDRFTSAADETAAATPAL